MGHIDVKTSAGIFRQSRAEVSNVVVAESRPVATRRLIQTNSDPFEEGLYLEGRLAGLVELFAQVFHLALGEPELRVELVSAGVCRPEFGVEAIRASGRRLQFGPDPIQCPGVLGLCRPGRRSRLGLQSREGPRVFGLHHLGVEDGLPPLGVRLITGGLRLLDERGKFVLDAPAFGLAFAPLSLELVAEIALEGGEPLAPKCGFLDLPLGLSEFFDQPADFLPMGLLRSRNGLSGFVSLRNQEVSRAPRLLDLPPSGVSLLASGLRLLTKPVEVRSKLLTLLFDPASRRTECFRCLLVLGVRSLPILAVKPFGFLFPRETSLFPLRLDRLAIRLPAPAALIVFAFQAIEIRGMPGRCRFQRALQLLNRATMGLRFVSRRPELVRDPTEFGAGLVALVGHRGEALVLVLPRCETVAEVVPFDAEPIALGVGRLKVGLPRRGILQLSLQAIAFLASRTELVDSRIRLGGTSAKRLGILSPPVAVGSGLVEGALQFREIRMPRAHRGLRPEQVFLVDPEVEGRVPTIGGVRLDFSRGRVGGDARFRIPELSQVGGEVVDPGRGAEGRSRTRGWGSRLLSSHDESTIAMLA